MAKPAVFAALALGTAPQLAPVMRRQALPDGMGDLLCVFARREEVIVAMMAELEMDDRMMLTDCVDNFIQKVVLHPEGAPHRMLAGTASSSRAELRGHLKLLLDGLHPDKTGGSWKAAYAPRVIAAWREVSQGRGLVPAARPAGGHRTREQLAWIAQPLFQGDRARARRRMGWTLAAVLVGALVLPWRALERALFDVATRMAP